MFAKSENSYGSVTKFSINEKKYLYNNYKSVIIKKQKAKIKKNIHRRKRDCCFLRRGDEQEVEIWTDATSPYRLWERAFISACRTGVSSAGRKNFSRALWGNPSELLSSQIFRGFQRIV